MMSATEKNEILRRWEVTLAENSDRGAIFDPSGKQLRTFAEIEEEIPNSEMLLESLQPGTIVAIQIGNSPAWPSVLLGAFRSGMIPLPIGQMTKEETDQVLRGIGAGALVTEGSGMIELDETLFRP